MIRRVLKRISDRDRLCYAMTFAFGLSLVTAISANIQGYCLYEGNTGVRVAELVIGTGLMALGVERVRKHRKSVDR